MEHTADHAAMSKGRIWKVFFILLALTGLEFIIALGIPETMLARTPRNIIYVILTLAKAYYIVAFFMHLKFEKTALILIISLSFILVVYLIILVLIEGQYLHVHMNP